MTIKSKNIIKKILKNNMKVVFIPNECNNLISVGLFIKVGSRNEDKENNGISHFIEHMLFKKQNVLIQLDELGAKYNAETNRETTHYYIYGINENYLDFIKILFNIYNSTKFKKEDIETEKNVILEEYNLYVNDLDDIIDNEIHKTLYKNSSLKYPIIGTKKNIKSFNKSILKKYWNKYYIPSNMMIIMCGNFNIEKSFNMINNTFGKLKSITINNLDKPIYNIQTEPKMYIIRDNVDQANINIVYKNLSNNIDKIYYDILELILSDGCTSILYKLLRTKLGLVYNTYSSNRTYLYEGFFSIDIQTSNNKINNCIKAILNEINKLKINGITKKQLNIAKKKYINHINLINNPIDIMEYYGFNELFDIKDNNNLDDINIKNINLFINELFDNNQLNIFIYKK
jgi:predicted Zn-dependent peptidase